MCVCGCGVEFVFIKWMDVAVLIHALVGQLLFLTFW